MAQTYSEGLHIIATLRCQHLHLMQEYAAFKNLISNLIEQNQLVELGGVYHNFSPAGFTAVVCLSESHISVHTWPEHQIVNFDVYLSNVMRNNDAVVRQIYEAVLDHFEGDLIRSMEVKR